MCQMEIRNSDGHNSKYVYFVNKEQKDIKEYQWWSYSIKKTTVDD